MTRGTCHFISRAAAVRYYSDYYKDPDAAVSDKLAAKEIAIGAPPLAPGEKLKLNREEGRYFIEEPKASR